MQVKTQPYILCCFKHAPAAYGLTVSFTLKHTILLNDLSKPLKETKRSVIIQATIGSRTSKLVNSTELN